MCRPDLRPVETARKTTVSITARFEAKNVTLITGLNQFNEPSKLQLATNMCAFLIYLVAVFRRLDFICFSVIFLL